MMIIGGYCQAQDAHFSQWGAAPIHTNPANTGVFDGFQRAIINYRNQWPSIGAPYKTMAFALDMPVYFGNKYSKRDNAYLGVGLTGLTDKAGDAVLSNNQLALSLSSIVRLSKKYTLSVGLQAAVLHRSINLDKVYNESQFSGAGGFNDNIISSELPAGSNVVMDLGAGVYLESSPGRRTQSLTNKLTWNIGAAAYHITRPSQSILANSIDPLHIKFVGQAKMRLDMDRGRYSLMPQAFFVMQGPNMEINAGAMYRMRVKDGTRITIFYTEQAISFGLHYRFKDAIIPSMIYEINNWAIGFSYDVNVSAYTPASNANGGFELSLKYCNFKGGELYRRRANPNNLRNPRF
jgi:type IX secretion system PorP/SprF family membrane protein